MSRAGFHNPNPEMPAAVILAGGLGTRLAPVLGDQPKVLAPVAGTPFLIHLIKHLRSQGIRNIVLCVGHKRHAIESALQDGSPWDVQLTHVSEETPLGTAGALHNARRCLSGTFLALNGDSFLQIDLRAFLAFHRSHGAAATLALTRVSDAGRYGAVNLDEHGLIREFLEKAPSTGSETWINAGFYALEQSALSMIASKRPCSLEYDLFPRLARDRQLYGWRCEGYFLDIGTPESYERAQREWRTQP